MILACHTVAAHCTERSIKTFKSSDPDCIATVDCKFDLNSTLHTKKDANKLARESASKLFGQLKTPNTEISRTNTMTIAFPARFIESNLETLPDQLLERINNYGMVKISFHEENLLAGNIQIMPVYGSSREESDVTAAVGKLPPEFAPRKAQTILCLFLPKDQDLPPSKKMCSSTVNSKFLEIIPICCKNMQIYDCDTNNRAIHRISILLDRHNRKSNS